MNIFKKKKEKEEKGLRDWVKLAYPTTANEAAPGTWVEATKHSLNKYKYATPQKLNEFNLRADGALVYDNNTGEFYVMFGTARCSLCKKSVLHDIFTTKEFNCDNCPLGKLGYKCGVSGSPYIDFTATGDPTRMIRALEEVIRKLESGELVMED